MPPGSAVLGALPPRGAGQVGGVQIFLKVLITGLGQQEPGHRCRLGHPGTALMVPVMIMRPRKGQQAQNCRKAEGQDSAPGFLPLSDLAWLRKRSSPSPSWLAAVSKDFLLFLPTPSPSPLALGALVLHLLTSGKVSGLPFVSLGLQMPAQPPSGFTLSLGLFIPPATYKHAMGSWHLQASEGQGSELSKHRKVVVFAGRLGTPANPGVCVSRSVCLCMCGYVDRS